MTAKLPRVQKKCQNPRCGREFLTIAGINGSITCSVVCGRELGNLKNKEHAAQGRMAINEELFDPTPQDEAFCARMIAAGYVKRDPVRDYTPTTLTPLAKFQEVHGHLRSPAGRVAELGAGE